MALFTLPPPSGTLSSSPWQNLLSPDLLILAILAILIGVLESSVEVLVCISLTLCDIDHFENIFIVCLILRNVFQV
jgi:hypothetical protein